MEVLGQPDRLLIARRPLVFGVAACVVMMVSCAWAWPFAIDDAWIAVRYARHLSRGVGYVWNVGGPRTDGVTPLPWALLLRGLAGGSPEHMMTRVKALGVVATAAMAAWWGAEVGRARGAAWVSWVAVAVLGLDVPLAAHAVSGMETALTTLLATGAAVSWRRPALAAALAGLAATLRPELVVWSLVLGAGFALRASPVRGLRAAALTAIAGAPFAACAAIRFARFGRPAPLSLFAKPSDLTHGLVYAGAAAVVSLAPILLSSPIALSRERGPARVIAIASLVHLLVIIAVGGDWMPYARLMVPIIPAILYAFVVVAEHAGTRATLGRSLLAGLLGVPLLARSVPQLRDAGVARAKLIEQARPVLSSAHRIATVDIGWPSAITDEAIVDLAGVTDPDVATLPGGHTSKRIDAAFLLAKAPDIVLFYTDLVPDKLSAVTPNDFPRVVEARLAGSELFNEHFAATSFLPLGRNGAGYVVYKPRL